MQLIISFTFIIVRNTSDSEQLNLPVHRKWISTLHLNKDSPHKVCMGLLFVFFIIKINQCTYYNQYELKWARFQVKKMVCINLVSEVWGTTNTAAIRFVSHEILWEYLDRICDESIREPEDDSVPIVHVTKSASPADPSVTLGLAQKVICYGQLSF